MVGYFLSASTASVMLSSTWLISGTLQKYYGIDPSTVKLLSLVMYVGPLMMSIPASYVISNHSLTTSLTIGILCTSLGAWLRCFVLDSFTLTLIGQCLAALGVSFFYNAPSQIAAKWFFAQNRISSTLLLTLCPIVFTFVTPSLSLLIIEDQPSSSMNSQQIQAINLYFKFQAVLITLSGCLGMLVFQERPPTPPSHSENAQRYPFCKSLQIFSDRSYLFALCQVGISVGIFNALSLFSSDLLKQYGLKRNEIALVYLIYLPVTIGSTLVVAFLSKFFEQTKFLLLLCQTSLLLVTLLLLALTDFNSPTLFIILLVLQAALVAPVTGLTLQIVADFTFPAVESFSAAFVVGSVCLFSLGFSFVLEALHSPSKLKLVFVVLVLMQGVAVLSSLFLKENFFPRKLADSTDFVLFVQKQEDTPPDESLEV